MSDIEEQSKKFGNFIDRRASTPVTITAKKTLAQHSEFEAVKLDNNQNERMMGMF